MNKYSKLQDGSEIIPNKCQRCTFNKPTIRKFDKVNKSLEYICQTCKNSDLTLKNLPIIPKLNFKELLFEKSKIPYSCDRCIFNYPTIRKYDSKDLSLEYICKDCKNSDDKLKHLPVTPKVNVLKK